MSSASTPSMRLSEPVKAPPRKSNRRQLLSDYFAISLASWDSESGCQQDSGEQPALRDPVTIGELIRAVARRAAPEIIAEADGVLVLAIPYEDQVFTGVFLAVGVDLKAASSTIGLLEPSPLLMSWLAEQTRWQPSQLLAMARQAREAAGRDEQTNRLTYEVESLSENLSSTYEEISLLYGVAQQLRISSTEDELARIVLNRLEDCVLAETLAVQLLPTERDAEQTEDAAYTSRERARFITAGSDSLTHDRFQELVENLELDEPRRPFVANRPLTESASWQFPEIRELILVPLEDNERQFGWLAAVNHQGGGEFGTVEANLMGSVAVMLGIHGNNRALYREQAEFVANVVRALVSAIDAKDPYTSGHSDRVARFAVRIALEMRYDAKQLNTIYMAGLMHDVGKIGIEDSVLRKAGRLSDAEFEHIKLHPELGCKILSGLKQLAEVLPAVRHHHEHWDGTGYPHGLAGEEIPEIARIMAVADAYDAMTSDRPYRQGLSDERVQGIMREGAGKQWDPRVMDAFFAAKSDILAIADRSRTPAETVDDRWI